VLLLVAAPLLVVGGLLAGTAAGDGDQPADAGAVSARDVRGASVPVPPPTTSATGAPTSTPASRSVPGVRPDTVVVPSLDVRADVTPIATEDGALTPPSDPLDVGWWSGGSRPGAGTGAAVITGHTVHTGGGAFDDLEELTSGDRVIVLSDGTTVAYDVATVEVLSRTELARESSTIFARSGRGRLVLITCEDWDGTAYRSNVVVTARPTAA
jgi:LPXTG-site transpeptidase (sortase) family protein